MDLALLIMLTPSTDSVDTSRDLLADARRYKQGDIVDCHLAGAHETLVGQDYIPNEPVSSPRLGFLYVRGINDLLPFEHVRQIVTQPITELQLITDGFKTVYLRNKQFRLDLNRLNNNERNSLLANKYLTISWQRAKATVNKKVIIDKYNHLLDDETNQISEVDF